MVSRKKTILIVEDDAMLRDALVEKITREGFKTFEARTGEQCLSLAFSNHPDLIILDILMPGLDGRSALKRLRADAWGKNARVLILTNLSSIESGVDADDVVGNLIKSDTKIGDVISKVNSLLLLDDDIGGISTVSESGLPEFRCECGKLLFKGTLHFSMIEVKCKRCGGILRIDASDKKFLG